MFSCFISWMSRIIDSTETVWPVDRIVLVTVDALEVDPLAVDQQEAVLDLDPAEADAGTS